MNKNLLVLAIVCLYQFSPAFAQKKKEDIDNNYRRSSLHTMMLQTTGDYLKKDLIEASYEKAPFPDKYNDHRLEERTLNADLYLLSKEELAAAKADTTLDNDNSKGKKNKQKRVEKELPYAIEKYFNENKIANEIVAKWFSRQENGMFNMEVIHERGSYDASALQAEIAKGSIRGLATLKDAGEELIKNTFVVLNKMSFVENEPIAYAVKESALIIADQIPNAIASTVARAAAIATYEATKDGYSVWTTAYLFQLNWDDETANAFYTDYWYDENWGDSTRVVAFDTASIFKLNYVGYQKGKSLVLVSIGKSETEIIEEATVRNVDKVFTKLQKEYDVFKTKIPIYSANPIMARIGLKEGVEPNDKFEVLEQNMDMKTGLTYYKRVAIVKADKKNIWDNQYQLGEGKASEEEIEEGEVEASAAKVDKKEKNEGTVFKGGGKIEPGMLLRQIK